MLFKSIHWTDGVVGCHHFCCSSPSSVGWTRGDTFDKHHTTSDSSVIIAQERTRERKTIDSIKCSSSDNKYSLVYAYVLCQRTIFFSINTFNRLICYSNTKIHFRLEISYDPALVEQSNCLWSFCTHKHMDKHSEYMFVNEVEIEL
jgi:hypothetical protein